MSLSKIEAAIEDAFVEWVNKQKEKRKTNLLFIFFID